MITVCFLGLFLKCGELVDEAQEPDATKDGQAERGPDAQDVFENLEGAGIRRLLGVFDGLHKITLSECFHGIVPFVQAGFGRQTLTRFEWEARLMPGFFLMHIESKAFMYC